VLHAFTHVVIDKTDLSSQFTPGIPEAPSYWHIGFEQGLTST